MKISYSNYPILGRLKADVLGNVFYSKENIDYESRAKLNNAWLKNKESFNKNIFIISKPFMEASEKAFDKLHDLFKDMLKNKISYKCEGTFVYGNSVYMVNLDYQDDDENNNNNKASVFIFHQSGTIILYVEGNGNSSKGWMSEQVLNGNVYGFPIDDEAKRLNIVMSAILRCIIFDMFKNYAEVETKTLKPKERLKDIDCKYTNDTDLTVTHLDSKWFTTLVNSQGFKVRGFFRLQPKKKDGEWTKELIWIDEFEKQGYNRQAKILNQDKPL